MEWTKKNVAARIKEISEKGFIPIPEEAYRRDDGSIGQVLEREFGVPENNIHLADLGTYELKGMRLGKKKSRRLTLFHQKPTSGMEIKQIFERFSYERPSARDGTPKRKLFTTIKGNRQNNRGFLLKAEGESAVSLYHQEEYLATWDLSGSEGKINQILLAVAETTGAVNSKEEKFHFVEAYILSAPKNIYEAITAGAVVMDLCIDQPAADFGKKVPHERGPHIRIPISKLHLLFDSIERIL